MAVVDIAQRRLLFERPARGYVPPSPPDLTRACTVVFDGESTGLQWYTADRAVGWAVAGYDARGEEVVPPTYLPFAHRGGDNIADPGTVHTWMRTQLRDKLLVGHNVQFDLQLARVGGCDLRAQGNTFADTRLMAALLDDHRRSFSLDALARHEGLDPKHDLDPTTIADLPGSAVAAYAEHDVRLTAILYHRYRQRLLDEGQAEVLALEGAAIPATVEMMANGVRLDVDHLERVIRALRQTQQDLLWEVVKQTGRALSPDSNTDWQWLFNRAGLPWGTTETGKPSFTADIVEAAAKADPVILLLWRAGKVGDLLSKFLIPWSTMHHNGVLYPTLHQLLNDEGGTVSGRYACAKPNLQQVLGKDKFERVYGWLGPEFMLKKLFIPHDPRQVWVSSDAKAIEMRLFADYSRSERLIRAYQANPDLDPHAQVTEWIKPYRPSIQRTQAKQGSFSKLYGSGLGTFARTLGVPVDEAQAIMNAYDAAFPEAKALFREAMSAAESRGWVRTRTGRRTRFEVDPASGRYTRTHKALNGIIQGFAADLNKLALIDTYAHRAALEIQMVMTVHDSAESNAPAGRVPEIAAHMNRQRYPLQVPIMWDTVAGPTWGDAK